jgi:hypothetical protein
MPKKIKKKKNLLIDNIEHSKISIVHMKTMDHVRFHFREPFIFKKIITIKNIGI